VPAGGWRPVSGRLVPASQVRPAGRRLIRVRPEIGDPHDAAVLVLPGACCLLRATHAGQATGRVRQKSWPSCPAARPGPSRSS